VPRQIAEFNRKLFNSCCKFTPKLESGTKYYGKVYVSLWAIPKGDYAKTYKTQFIRLKYDEFHLITPYMMVPFEYAFVVLVIIAIVAAICTIGNRYIKKIYRKIGGFSMVSGNDEESDIDQKLEDYFLNNRSKFEEQFEEYKTSDGITKNVATTQEKSSTELTGTKKSNTQDVMRTPQKKNKKAPVPKKSNENSMAEKKQISAEKKPTSGKKTEISAEKKQNSAIKTQSSGKKTEISGEKKVAEKVD